MFGHRFKGERLGRSDDGRAVDGQARQGGRLAARRQQDRVGLQRGRLAVGALDLDLARGNELGGAVDGGDAVLLEQPGDAAGEVLDDLVLALEHGAEVEFDLGQLDAELGGVVLGLGVELAGVEQGLAGDAADVEAGAAERGALLDAGDLLAELGGADGGDVAAGTGPDDDQIVALRHSRVDLRGPRGCPGSFYGMGGGRTEKC